MTKRKSRGRAKPRPTSPIEVKEPREGELMTSDGAIPLIENNRDLSLCARMLSLGVVPPDRAAKVVARSFEFAEEAEDVKEYAAAMNVVFKASDQVLKATKQNQPIHNNHLHVKLPADSPGDIRAKIASKIGLGGVSESD